MNFKQFIKNIRRKVRNFFMHSGLPVTILSIFYNVLCATLRFKQDRKSIASQDEVASAYKIGEATEQSKIDPVVFCLWHDELFPLSYLKQDLDIIAIVSASKDGSILEKVLQKNGVHTASGSSRRGGLQALLKTVRIVDENKWHAVITIDGPMGPRHKAKDGAFLLAYKTKARIVPVRLIMNSSWKLDSWDKFQVPLPFSKVEVTVGQGFYVTEELTEENLALYREQLEMELETIIQY